MKLSKPLLYLAALGLSAFACANQSAHNALESGSRTTREPKTATASTPLAAGAKPKQTDALAADADDTPLVATKPFVFKRQCGKPVTLEPEMGPNAASRGAVSSARPLSGSTVVRINTLSFVETSLDGGKTWKTTLDPNSDGPRWLEVDAHGVLWAANQWKAWYSRDGLSWSVPLPLPAVSPYYNAYFSGLFLHRGEPWVYDPAVLVRLSSAKPPGDWFRVTVPGVDRIHDVASEGRNFLAFGRRKAEKEEGDPEHGVIISFDRSGSPVMPPLQSWGNVPACIGAACAAIIDDELAVRDAPHQPWRRFGDTLALSKWYVAHCNATSLGPVAQFIRQAKSKMFYTIPGLAFDGETVVVSTTISPDNNGYHPVAIVAGPNGVRLVPYGWYGVWAKGPGEFWLFGPEIRALKVATPPPPKGPASWGAR